MGFEGGERHGLGRSERGHVLGEFEMKVLASKETNRTACVPPVDQSLEASTAPEKGNATACATCTPAAQAHQRFGRCSAASSTPSPTRRSSTAGFRCSVQVRSGSSIFQNLGHSPYQKAYVRGLCHPAEFNKREKCTVQVFYILEAKITALVKLSIKC